MSMYVHSVLRLRRLHPHHHWTILAVLDMPASSGGPNISIPSLLAHVIPSLHPLKPRPDPNTTDSICVLVRDRYLDD